MNAPCKEHFKRSDSAYESLATRTGFLSDEPATENLENLTNYPKEIDVTRIPELNSHKSINSMARLNFDQAWLLK